MRELTLRGLIDIMRECAGVDETVDLDSEVGDVSFEDLGYDSVALLETAGRIEREFGVVLGDETVEEAKTPQLLLDCVNQRIAGAA
ncbi:MAG TPA: acyl carrier protein [Streptosporangiaceae bacterium]|nr:acyl carrier protein [Streptosporangiaceae bacterium]